MAKRNVGRFLNEFRKTDSSERKRTGNLAYVQLSGTMTENKVRFLSLRIIKFFRYISRLFSHASAKAYGMAAFSFGIVALLLYFLKLTADASIQTPIVAAAVALVAIPFMLADKPVPMFLQDFAVTDYIFFEFFCIKRFSKMESVYKIPLLIPILLGVACACIGLIHPIWYVLIAVAALLFVCITLMSPEFALFASFLALPYMQFIPYSSVLFITLIVLSVVSFARKSFFGKRVFYFDIYDVILAAFMLIVLISGIFVKGMSSFTSALCFFFVGFGYTLSNNVVTNRRLADRAVNSIVISSLIPAIVAISDFVKTIIVGKAADLIDTGVFFAFYERESFAVFMLVASVFAIAMFRQAHGVKKIFYAFALAIEFLALVLTGEMFAVLALLLGVAVFYIIRSGKGTIPMICVLALVPYLALLLPKVALDSLFSVIPSLESAAELFALWRASLSAFAKNIFIGIGVGADSFVAEMAETNISNLNSANIFIEVGLEAGLFALVCFVALIVVRLIHRASYYPYIKNSVVSTLAPICSVCIFSLITYGSVSHIFADMYSCYIFWCVFGIGSATLRVAKRETDDRIHYYEDTRASDSSAIDVEIR